jgi:hypothetical protein
MIDSVVVYLVTDTLAMFLLEILPLNIIKTNQGQPALRWAQVVSISFFTLLLIIRLIWIVTTKKAKEET